MARRKATEPEPQIAEETWQDEADAATKEADTELVKFVSANPRQIVALHGGYARFEYGEFCTDDQRVIAILDACECVRRA